MNNTARHDGYRQHTMGLSPAVRTRKRDSGIALITVLSVLALVATLSTTALLWQQTAVQRTARVLQASQGLDYLHAMQTWVEVVLLRDLRTSQIDTLQENWALSLMSLAVERGTISGQLEDMQGRFNLNNLVVDNKVQTKSLARFQRLLQAVGVDDTAAIQIVNAVRDWQDSDQEESVPGGAEDYHYLALSPPYRASDGPFLSTSELLLVKGMTADIWKKIEPYVSALPGYHPVNLNTAPKVVLQSLSADMSDALVEDILDRRLSDPFGDVQAFLSFRKGSQDENLRLPVLAAKSLSVTSHYFLLKGTVAIAEQTLQAQMLIQRNKQQAAVIRRSFGQTL